MDDPVLTARMNELLLYMIGAGPKPKDLDETNENGVQRDGSTGEQGD